jgi:hypothetical protein
MNRLTSILVVAVVSLMMAVTPSVAYGAAWYDSDWTYAKLVTIDNTQVDATLTDFPLLVNYTSSDVGTNAQADCDDIIFTDNTNVTKYPHEIEQCDLTANDWFTAWVNVPSVSSSVDTTLYMYYGNSTMTAQENVTATWNSNYEAVYHLHDDFLDSTSNGRDGTNTGSTDAAAQIANGQSFDGVNDNIAIGTWGVSGTDLTIQTWINFDAFTIADARLFAKATGTATQDHAWMISTTNSGGDDLIRLRLKNGTSDSGSTTTLVGTTDVNIGNDYFVMIKKDSTNMEIFLNGVQDATDSKTGNLRVNAWGVEIGDNPNSTPKTVNGNMDEVRVLSVAVSDEWNLAEYDNQKAASTFITVGAQGTEAGGASSFTRNVTDELGLEDSAQTMVGLVISITDELGLEDSAAVQSAMIVRSITDELGLEDLVVVQLANEINITDELGLEDGVQVLVSAVLVTDELGLEDSVEVDLIAQVFNAIKLYLAPPTTDRLGGVFEQSCDSGYYVSGINSTGNIVCTVLP